ncbi:MAG TPA: cysteine desulfurase-like protein [Anaerolineales bacterium]|nr:cysteine desulfurase-like protein [Anaerolineales bacterium]
MSLQPALIREQFPSLKRADVFFDNPGGTQIARHSLERIQRYLLECNANHEGAFRTSRASDSVLQDARQAMADFLNAPSADEIVFGNNMTTITFNMARALSKRLSPGDEIVITRLDHDANISPWLLTAEDRGCKITWVDFDVEDGTLKLDEFARAMQRRPKIVAFGYASNALGTINPVRQLTQLARQAGALVYVDAVQYAPHGPIDVQQLECDFLVCSSYKFFGPHAAALYGRLDLLRELQPYKVRPATNEAPNKFETGTQNHEGIAGILGAIEYFEWLGKQASESGDWRESGFSGRRLTLKQAMTAIRAHEFELSRALIEAIESIPGTRLYGIADARRLEERVPTISFTMEGIDPRRLAERLAEAGFYTWDGNYYALAVTERLGVEDRGGMLRVGAVHYNTLEEVERLRQALDQISRSLK